MGKQIGLTPPIEVVVTKANRINLWTNNLYIKNKYKNITFDSFIFKINLFIYFFVSFRREGESPNEFLRLSSQDNLHKLQAKMI